MVYDRLPRCPGQAIVVQVIPFDGLRFTVTGSFNWSIISSLIPHPAGNRWADQDQSSATGVGQCRYSDCIYVSPLILKMLQTFILFFTFIFMFFYVFFMGIFII